MSAIQGLVLVLKVYMRVPIERPGQDLQDALALFKINGTRASPRVLVHSVTIRAPSPSSD